ncbi:spermidine synthase [Effusibacillus dendaii]|uniref:PABS domain-containing protein n=1 Tax=Effusibacillus dendaii TaxID=2743772 RepID=A0A7I8DD33_9BACL|nr:fused MFS/spermidine synthase [Effusibacillus dendaii]BCJ85801.1 hypothetical protein skT53_07860 [Effusibacillus dendaii]
MNVDFSLFRKTRLIWKKRSPIQTVYVYQKGSVRYMRFASESWQGALDMKNKEKLLFPYQRFFLAYRAWMPNVRSFLSLGVGTGTAIRSIRRLHPDARIVGVDLDEAVLEAAVKYFECPCDQQTELHAMHGRAFLESTAERFDLVFLDTYDSFSIPKSMRTVQSFQSIYQVLQENGLLVVNVIGTLKGPMDSPFKTTLKTVQEVFPDVWVLPVSRWSRFEQNILLIARKRKPGDFLSDVPVHEDSLSPEVAKLVHQIYSESIPTEDIQAEYD